MKKYGIFLILLVLVSLWDFSKNERPNFGIKSNGYQNNDCKRLCEKVTVCLKEEQKKLHDPKMFQYACEILCTKQFQLFSNCSIAIEQSCVSGELCIKNQTQGFF